MCCSALPINHIYKHLTEKAVRDSSDSVVHGYTIRPSEKAALEQEIHEMFHNAPLTSPDLQKIVPLLGQLGTIVMLESTLGGYVFWM